MKCNKFLFNSDYVSSFDGTQVYFEEYGNPLGKPILVFHGGPGSKISPRLTEFFDLSFFRLILFDQRGCGKSGVLGDITKNETDFILKDVDFLLDYLKVSKAIFFGGSWGATLALRYAQTRTEKCLSILIQGVFFGNDDWFFLGVKNLFPDIWEKFTKEIPDPTVLKIADFYIEKFNGNEESRKQAIQSFREYERSLAFISSKKKEIKTIDANEISSLKVFLHYSRNNYFIPRGKIFSDINKIRYIKSYLIQGRYDFDSPLYQAYSFAKQWPKLNFYVVENGGHSSREKAIKEKVVEVGNLLKTDFKKTNLSY